MKILILLVIISSTLTNAIAQINVGSRKVPMYGAGEIEKEEMDKLKASKTIFFYRDADAANVAMWESLIKKYWTFTEISLAPYSTKDEYEFDGETSFFVFDGAVQLVNYKKCLDIFLKLYLPFTEEDEDDEDNERNFIYCRIDLMPSEAAYKKVVDAGGGKRVSTIYATKVGELYNWTPGIMANSLHFVQTILEENETRMITKSDDENVEILSLKEGTLYLPDYLQIEYGEDNGARISESELTEDYPYAYDFITADELDNLITSSTEPFYYMTYVRSGVGAKYISIFNGQTGMMVYSKVATQYGGKFKADDLENVADAIEDL